MNSMSRTNLGTTIGVDYRSGCDRLLDLVEVRAKSEINQTTIIANEFDVGSACSFSVTENA